MNYAIYFGLAFAGCFMAVMLVVILLGWFSDMVLFEGDDEWKDK